MSSITAIIVTHNSQRVLPDCLAALARQSVPVESIVVDSGSVDTAYLKKNADNQSVTVLYTDNVGFARANNIAYGQLHPESDYVLFLNPDAFLDDLALAEAVKVMESPGNTTIGCLTGRLLAFDGKAGRATGCLDSTGIFRKWFGRWYDRGQGEQDLGQYLAVEDVPAACGAFMFCRKTVLDDISLSRNEVFDPDFFLYKEDIELSLRIRRAGKRIVYAPDITVLHCRGWHHRSDIPYPLRLEASRSEILLCRKHPTPYLFWALLKYILVRYLKL